MAEGLREALLTHLLKHLADEPVAPDLEKHVGHHLETVARRYDEWERTGTALRHLLGQMLVNDAIDRGDLGVTEQTYIHRRVPAGPHGPRDFFIRVEQREQADAAAGPTLQAGRLMELASLVIADGHVLKNRWAHQ